MNDDCQKIHFVTDKWVSPSIKDCECDQSWSSSITYQISGVGQKRAGNWLQTLTSSSFKKPLIEFLVKVWSDDSFSEILKHKVLFLNNDDTCWRHESVNGCVLTEEVNHLSCSHEEANIKIFYHLSSIQSNNNVVLQTNYTDCLIIGLSPVEKLAEDVNVWIEAGVQSTNSQRFISLNQFYITLGKTWPLTRPIFVEEVRSNH